MKFFAVLPLLMLPVIAAGHEPVDHYDRVQLSAAAQAQVDNDTVVATLYAQEEGSDTAQLAAIVNDRINAAIALVKQHKAIKIRTSGYTTSPVHHKSKITGWRVRQTLRLETQEMTLMSSVLGSLQQTLALQGLNFTVSPELKNATDDELIVQALKVFDQRANLVTGQLGRKNYRIVDINVSTTARPYQRPLYDSAVMAASKVAAPVLEAGEQTLQVTVSGQIELE